jgi:hypothetical protein
MIPILLSPRLITQKPTTFAVVCALLLTLTVSSPTSHAAEKVEVRGQMQASIQLKNGGRAVPGVLKVLEVRMATAGAKIQDRNLIAVYDPASKLFWWTYQNPDGSADATAAQALFSREYHIVEDRDQLVGFVMTGWSLWIRTSSMKADSVQDGVGRLVASLPGPIELIEADISAGFREVNLAKVLGQGFLVRTDPGAAGRVLWLVDVEREPSRWLVTLRNTVGESKKIALNDLFQFVDSANR